MKDNYGVHRICGNMQCVAPGHLYIEKAKEHKECMNTCLSSIPEFTELECDHHPPCVRDIVQVGLDPPHILIEEPQQQVVVEVLQEEEQIEATQEKATVLKDRQDVQQSKTPRSKKRKLDESASSVKKLQFEEPESSHGKHSKLNRSFSAKSRKQLDSSDEENDWLAMERNQEKGKSLIHDDRSKESELYKEDSAGSDIDQDINLEETEDIFNDVSSPVKTVPTRDSVPSTSTPSTSSGSAVSPAPTKTVDRNRFINALHAPFKSPVIPGRVIPYVRVERPLDRYRHLCKGKKKQ